jgi:hypothetical protein
LVDFVGGIFLHDASFIVPIHAKSNKIYIALLQVVNKKIKKGNE